MISTNSPITASYPLPPKRQGPDFPFKLISAFASSHQWKNFTTSLCLKETQLVIDSQRAQTSCIETLRNLCHIFLTTNEARSVYQSLLYTTKGHKTFNLKDGEQVVLTIKELLYDASRKKNERTEEKSDTRTPQTSLSGLFQNYISRFMETSQIFYNELADLKYDFNEPIISNLRSDIYRNRASIDETTSYIYFIAILEFEPENNTAPLYHCFTLEQFCCEGKDLYRIYQSSQNAYSLSENLAQKGYGSDGENCESWVKINKLFKETTRLLSPYSQISKQEIFRIQKKYFGATRVLEKPTFFDSKTCTINGTSFRYIARKITNFRETLSNLHKASSNTAASQEVSNFVRTFAHLHPAAKVF